MVKDISELPRRVNEAFEIATSGRPGPVLVDLPKNVTAGVLQKPIPPQPYIPSRPRNPHSASYEKSTSETGACAFASSLRKATELINQARRPIIYAGQGVLSHPDGPAELRKLAAQSNIPVTTTLQGMGAFDELDDRSLHMLGMHGSAYANLAMQSADLIIALGARFDDRVTGNLNKFAPEAKRAAAEGRGGFLHFEIMPKNINKVVQATEAVEGDVTANLKRIMPHVVYRERKEWFDKIAEWKRKYPFSYAKPTSPAARFKPQQVIEELDRQTAHMKQDVIITTGVGQHQMWAAQFFRWRAPRSFITSGGLGTMGFGLPAAIGAKAAMPNKTVIDIDGDASFSMTAMELATAAQFGIGVKVLLLNNDFQGMWQDLFYERRYSATQMTNPDFVKLAESMGCMGLRLVAGVHNLSDVIRQFLEYPGPVLLEAVVEKNEHVYPMVPAGKGLNEMELGPDIQLTEEPYPLEDKPYFTR
ncbi:MAG: thiamine diphosphate-binding protein [Olpidium bornovanus]|uniref:acetolactate synthase n=1 Tax=Olpidium bornovanus TaxID=278681 RepID=A0A8H8DES9_9FUNG|nr:MAG: thiamine diphosphate-binding protein [Olpidium bornovanus]